MDSAAGCSGTPPICRQAQTKLEVALYMFLWSPDTEAVLVAMSCFRHLCEEADIRCGVDEVSVHNFLPNYNTFMEFASVSNMMSTGRAALQKRVMALLRRIEHPTAGNTEVCYALNNRNSLPRLPLNFRKLVLCMCDQESLLKQMLRYVHITNRILKLHTKFETYD